MNGPQWLGGAPSFSLTVTPAEVLPLIRAAVAYPEDGRERIKLAAALAWLDWRLSTPENRFDTEEKRIAAAEAAGRAVAQLELWEGVTAPRDWTKDGEPYAGAYSYLAAAGFKRAGTRMYCLTFIRAYRNEFPGTEDTEG
jgi:hypothetical protein